MERPLDRLIVDQYLAPLDIDRAKYPLLIVGLRGFYADSDVNKRGIYDDAIGIVTDQEFFFTRANTDPSRTGRNTKINKGFAVLAPGFYPSYKFDVHNGSTPHKALCQRVAPVTVNRDGGKQETGMFGINIHRGGFNSTSSEGCQTFSPPNWIKFFPLAEAEARRLWGKDYAKRTVGYALIECTKPL